MATSRPISYELLMDALRRPGVPRPEVDRSLAASMRVEVEDALRPWLERLGKLERPGKLERLGNGDEGSRPRDPLPTRGSHPDRPIRLTKARITQVLACAFHARVSDESEQSLTPAMVRGVLVDRIFRLGVTAGVDGDPVQRATEALVAENETGALVYLDGLHPVARSRLEDSVRAVAEGLLSVWRPLDWRHFPRTQVAWSLPFGAGRVVFGGKVDLFLGRPHGERASTCLVDLKTGNASPDHVEDMRFYALLETLRSGSPPFQVASYYGDSGELDAEQVDEGLLRAALDRAIEAMVTLCRLEIEEVPEPVPNPECRWCRLQPSSVTRRQLTGRDPAERRLQQVVAMREEAP